MSNPPIDREELFFEAETRKHQQEVARFMMRFARLLIRRAGDHDLSKLLSPEREIFIEFTPKLKGCTYGSEEYKGFLAEMKVALDHHYTHNPHHPEFHADGVEDMTLVDVVEMICDWMAAVKRHADGDIIRSIRHNEKRFKITPQLSNILRLTASVLGDR